MSRIAAFEACITMPLVIATSSGLRECIEIEAIIEGGNNPDTNDANVAVRNIAYGEFEN